MIILKNTQIKQGFTLIELIVVISIISLISVNSVFYFHDFIGKQELSYDLSELESVISDLDSEINKQDSFDYSLMFNKNDYGYIVSKDSIGNQINQEASFNTVTGISNIELSPTSEEIWEIKIYKGLKKYKNLTKNGSETLNIGVENNTSIISTLSGSTLNKLNLYYFDMEKDTYVKNTFVRDIVDNNNTSYNSLIIKNISGNKIYYSDTQVLESPIYVIFEKNGIESKLEFN